VPVHVFVLGKMYKYVAEIASKQGINFVVLMVGHGRVDEAGVGRGGSGC